MKSIFTILIFLNGLISFQLSAQPEVKDFKDIFRLNISETSEKIEIDGKLEEAVWQTTDMGTDFWQKLPYFDEHAEPRTEVRLTYDDDFLYVAAKCYQSEPINILSLKRDNYWDNDGIAVILDPLNTRANAFLFGSTAAGAQWDALRSETSDVNADWNNRWYSEVHVTDNYWSLEMAIPFRILRYSENLDEWGINFVRNLTYKNQFHNWTAVPESFWPPNPAFAGSLVWDKPPTRKKGNFNLIPYVTTRVEQRTGEKTKVNAAVGGDARVAVSSTLNLDVTINPDFSQIEVDELVTNLTRFNIFLPEKRTFFLENGDLFADFGFGQARPFFSRTIGLDENRQAVPILYGLRLTGNVSPSLRIGAMNIQSGATDNAFGQNQSAISFQQQFGRSFVQGMFLNRQAYDEGKQIKQDYSRNASLENVFVSTDGKITAAVGLHQSFKPNIKESTGFYNAVFVFRNTNWEVLNDAVMMQENYYADMGFLARIENYDAERDTFIRLGYNQNYTSVDYRLRPKNKAGKIALHRFGVENLLIFNSDWSFNERYNRFRYFIDFRNTSSFQIRLNNNELELLFPFSFTGETPLPAQRYNFWDLNLVYNSDERAAFSYSLTGQVGDFYNGTLNRLEASVNYRVQPWGNFSVGYQFNDIRFPEPYGESKIAALLSKIEIGFNRNLLWTTLFQYVAQSNYMGINSRLQWQFAPMSDLFLVYVDNYDVFQGLNPRSNNRALILKVNYWY